MFQDQMKFDSFGNPVPAPDVPVLVPAFPTTSNRSNTSTGQTNNHGSLIAGESKSNVFNPESTSSGLSGEGSRTFRTVKKYSENPQINLYCHEYLRSIFGPGHDTFDTTSPSGSEGSNSLAEQTTAAMSDREESPNTPLTSPVPVADASRWLSSIQTRDNRKLRREDSTPNRASTAKSESSAFRHLTVVASGSNRSPMEPVVIDTPSVSGRRPLQASADRLSQDKRNVVDTNVSEHVMKTEDSAPKIVPSLILRRSVSTDRNENVGNSCWEIVQKAKPKQQQGLFFNYDQH